MTAELVFHQYNSLIVAEVGYLEGVYIHLVADLEFLPSFVKEEDDEKEVEEFLRAEVVYIIQVVVA
jgi:hypothetical protein